MSKETIGPRIKRFRKKRRLTQDELAASLGYSGKSVISHIEKGDADMTYEKILLLLRTYMLDANELFEIEKIDKQIDDFKNEQKKNKTVVVYIHGLYGSADESKEYSFLEKEYDVVGLDYQDGNPWELKDIIRSEFKKITKNYGEIVIIANSIGAFYSIVFLSDFDIKHAFFISLVVDMHQIILNFMKREGISEKELEQKKYITCKDGMVLSFDFYKDISHHEDSWKIPTDILYGSFDELISIESIIGFVEDHPNSKLTIKKKAKHYFHTSEEKEFIKDWIFNSLSIEK